VVQLLLHNQKPSAMDAMASNGARAAPKWAQTTPDVLFGPLVSVFSSYVFIYILTNYYYCV
jgi:hypothetical protein